VADKSLQHVGLSPRASREFSAELINDSASLSEKHAFDCITDWSTRSIFRS